MANSDILAPNTQKQQINQKKNTHIVFPTPPRGPMYVLIVWSSHVSFRRNTYDIVILKKLAPRQDGHHLLCRGRDFSNALGQIHNIA